MCEVMLTPELDSQIHYFRFLGGLDASSKWNLQWVKVVRRSRKYSTKKHNCHQNILSREICLCFPPNPPPTSQKKLPALIVGRHKTFFMQIQYNRRSLAICVDASRGSFPILTDLLQMIPLY